MNVSGTSYVANSGKVNDKEENDSNGTTGYRCNYTTSQMDAKKKKEVIT